MTEDPYRLPWTTFGFSLPWMVVHAGFMAATPLRMTDLESWKVADQYAVCGGAGGLFGCVSMILLWWMLGARPTESTANRERHRDVGFRVLLIVLAVVAIVFGVNMRPVLAGFGLLLTLLLLLALIAMRQSTGRRIAHGGAQMKSAMDIRGLLAVTAGAAIGLSVSVRCLPDDPTTIRTAGLSGVTLAATWICLLVAMMRRSWIAWLTLPILALVHLVLLGEMVSLDRFLTADLAGPMATGSLVMIVQSGLLMTLMRSSGYRLDRPLG